MVRVSVRPLGSTTCGRVPTHLMSILRTRTRCRLVHCPTSPVWWTAGRQSTSKRYDPNCIVAFLSDLLRNILAPGAHIHSARLHVPKYQGYIGNTENWPRTPNLNRMALRQA